MDPPPSVPAHTAARELALVTSLAMVAGVILAVAMGAVCYWDWSGRSAGPEIRPLSWGGVVTAVAAASVLVGVFGMKRGLERRHRLLPFAFALGLAGALAGGAGMAALWWERRESLELRPVLLLAGVGVFGLFYLSLVALGWWRYRRTLQWWGVPPERS